MTQPCESTIYAELRRSTEEDLPFVIHSIVLSLHSRFPWEHVGLQTWHTEARVRVLQMLAVSRVTVACDPSDPSVIWGFCVAREQTLHWVYVKFPFRRFGIARQLVLAACPEFGRVPHTITSLPDRNQAHPDVGAFLKRHQLSYNPFAGFLSKES